MRLSSDSHIAKCDKDNCLVCHSRLCEFQEVFQPIYLYILLQGFQDDENATLDKYT